MSKDLEEVLKKLLSPAGEIGANFSFVPDFSRCDCCDGSVAQGGTVVHKNETEVRTMNRVFLMIINTSDPT